MQTLPLTQNKIALISDEDYAALNQWKWTYMSNERSGYAVRYETRSGKKRTIYMHRQIMNAPRGRLVDHEDGNGLNNQRYNLRVCGGTHNLANRAAPVRTIPFKGVYLNPPHCQRIFFAQIKAFRHNYRLGNFSVQADAARAYDRAALYFFGSFARLNFPDDIESTLAIPLAPIIVNRLESSQLAFDLEEPLPEIQIGRLGWAEIQAHATARRYFIKPTTEADLIAIDDLL